MKDVKTNIRIYTKCTYTLLDSINKIGYKYGEFKEGLGLEECYIIAGGDSGFIFTPKSLRDMEKNYVCVHINTEREFLRLLELSLENQGDYVAEVCMYAVKKNIHKLTSLVKKRIGIRLQKPKFEIRKGKVLIEFEDELLQYLGTTLVRTLFTTVKLTLWGGEYLEREGMIHYRPNLHYEHPEGGSNGVKFIWQWLYFDLKKNRWLEKEIIIK